MKGRIFNTDQVRAIQDGRMSQFMQEVKDKHVLHQINVNNHLPSYFEDTNFCPFGKVGDVIYVKETTVRAYVYEWEGFGETPPLRYYYRADDDWKEQEWHDEYNDCPSDAPKWKSAVHMPIAAARLFLRITNIRVMRVQELQEEDFRKQGYYERIPGFLDETFTYLDANHKEWTENKFNWVLNFEKCNKA